MDTRYNHVHGLMYDLRKMLQSHVTLEVSSCTTEPLPMKVLATKADCAGLMKK
jgi:hypothetical protein